MDNQYSMIPDNYTSQEQVIEALQITNLESANLIIGIDFTKSNEWTGKQSFNGLSLHHIGKTKNPYEQAISCIGNTLSGFYEDNKIPCFGFGDASTKDKDVFSFYQDGSACNGIGEVQARYRELVPDKRLSGPTSFAPIINKAVDVVIRSGYRYHVLIIIADGQATSSGTEMLSCQEECTQKAIQRASNFPLSIVLVGVGDGPWDLVNKYDNLLHSRHFDNFQFVNFTKIMSMNMPDSAKEEQFALQALVEIPLQYAAIQGLGILGAPPRRSIPQISSGAGFESVVETFDHLVVFDANQEPSDHPSTEEALHEENNVNNVQSMKRTTSTMSKETKRLEEKLAKKSTELEKLIKRHNEVLKENKVLRDMQHDMAIELEKLHQQIEERTSMNYDEANLMKFSYLDLKEATCNFNENLEIGKGGYGRVYKAVLHCTIVAIKVLHSGGNQGEREFYQEVEVLKNVRHPNIVALIGGCLQNWALVYEFIPNGSLENYISPPLGVRKSKSLSWKIRIQIASNICSALIFLHSTKPHGIAHGDLKPANILLNSNYQAKLSDFGISRLLMKADDTVAPHHLTEYPKGTLAYIDPEYLRTGEMNPQCDVYSFGIILLQLVTGKSALGISKSVQEALQSHRFKKELDASAKWPFKKAIKMAELSLRCCDPTRKNRPNLASEVWCAIESMKTDASS